VTTKNNWTYLVSIFLLVASFSAIAEPVRTAHSYVELISEYSHIESNANPFELGINLSPDAGWHAYWINPGDAGKEPAAEWKFPSDGWEASPFAFPPPSVIPYDTLITYGYDESILLQTTITPPSNLGMLDSANIVVNLNWVVCDDEYCVPESTQLSINLPISSDKPTPRSQSQFNEARAKLAEKQDWDARYFVNGDVVEFRIVPADKTQTFTNPYLFVAHHDLVQYDQQSASQFAEGLFFTMSAHRWAERVDSTFGIVTYTDRSENQQAVEISLTKDDGSFVSIPVSQMAAQDISRYFSITSPQTLIAAILAAFVGGILLNLMPCVFPILSLKAIHVVERAESAPAANRMSGLMYTAGILVAFLIIGVALLTIRATGMGVGWGFQLQSSITNVVLALLMVAIGLNLLGVYEIGTKLMGVGANISAASDNSQNFLVGLLAVVVATPCVTPFMAPAIGWAFTQPAYSALTTLMALGLGLALPYLLICYVPFLAKILPRPGNWMSVFRQLMAYPMLLTAIWLFWVVGRQLGATSMAMALVAAVALAFTLWGYGQGAISKLKWSWYSLAFVGLAATVALVVTVENYQDSGDMVAASSEQNGHGLVESFDETQLQGYIAANQPSFVYFTADWCITCKVNERVALSTDEVTSYFEENNIKVIEADWTKQDATITKWLELYERVGVPMYLYFPSGSTDTNATVLPQILYPDLVIQLVEEANRKVALSTNRDLGSTNEQSG